MEALPPTGVPAEEVLAELRALRSRDLPTHGGRLFAYVFDPAVPGLDHLTASAHALSAHVNGLDPTAFPSVPALENDLVAASARLLGAGPGTAAPGVVGTVTSGGTESILLAVKAARDGRRDVATPRMIMPTTAHPAFAKGAAAFRVAVDVVPVDPVTMRPDPAAVAAAITADTVLVVCSAPSYPHGVIDPVSPIAAAALERGVRCHVDACFGGWTLPYLRRLGAEIPPFDLSVPGVTSISVDLHKYAYCPKGVSVLLHRDAALRRPLYFAYAGWPGYTLVNSVLASTRSGGPIAAAWATLRHIGDDGYLALAGRTREAVRGLVTAVSTVDGLRIVGDPTTGTVVCFASDDDSLDVLVLADELGARGWHTQVQLRYGEIPPTVHLTVTPAVAPSVPEFGPALAAAARAARAAGPAKPPAELLALAPGLTADDLTPEFVAQVAGSLGLGSGAPVRMAEVNALLTEVSPALREGLVAEFLSHIQTPAWR